MAPKIKVSRGGKKQNELKNNKKIVRRKKQTKMNPKKKIVEPKTKKCTKTPKKKVIVRRKKNISVTPNVSNKKKPKDQQKKRGWNATWDRFVTEDYVLKDTAENRQLQKELAEKAQLTTAVKFCRGGNLYKRDLKKRRQRLTEKVNDSLETQTSPTIAPSQRKEQASARCQESSSDDWSDEDVINLPIPDRLKRFLEQDCLLIKQNKLVKLPVKNNVLSILEGYVKDYALKELSGSQRENERPSRAASSSQKPKISVDSLCKRMNLCKETADGLRVYFDHTLSGLLLYAVERSQYDNLFSNIKQEDLINSDTSSNCNVLAAASAYSKNPEIILNNVKIEYDSVPKIDSSSNNKHTNNSLGFDKKDTSSTNIVLDNNLHKYSKSNISDSDRGNRRKSLRSHKLAPVQEETNEAPPSKTPTVLPILKECASSSTSVSSLETSSQKQLRHRRPLSPPVECPKKEALLRQIMTWKIIPPEILKKDPHVMPSQVYGAIHLARLFVKLPELLQQTNMEERKLNVLLKYLTAFMEYLESHDEWFGEAYYVDNVSSDT